nr:thymidine kinase [Macronycteris gammaherpesvirus 1]
MAEGGYSSSEDEWRRTGWRKSGWKYLDNSDSDTASTSTENNLEWDEVFPPNNNVAQNKKLEGLCNPQDTFYRPKKKPQKCVRRLVKVDVPTQQHVLDSDSDTETSNTTFQRTGWKNQTVEFDSPELLHHQNFMDRLNKKENIPKSSSKLVKSKQWLQKKVKSAKGATKLNVVKDLSGGIKSLMLNNPEQKNLHHGSQLNSVLSVETILGTNICPSFKNALFVYLEGCMGVGKTSLIKYMKEVGEDNIVSFMEPMVYWRDVYTDCVKEVYKACKSSGSGTKTTSTKVFSAQMKFMTPMKCLQTSVKRYVKADEPLQEKNPMDNWILFDRHILSPTIVFPLVFFKKGLLTCDHFLTLMSNFRASEGDTIVLMCMDEADNLKLIRQRNRKDEGVIDSEYLMSVSHAFHSCYCTWLMLKYFSPEDMLSVCCCDVSLDDLCIMRSMSHDKLTTAKNMFSMSLFNVIINMIQPFKTNSTIIEICLSLFMELKKLEFLLVNVSEYIDDIPGVWSSIYMQTFKTKAIKTQIVDWTGLKAFGQAFNS